MSEICSTVMVLMDGKPVRINQSDYDAAPDTFALVTDAMVAPEPEKPALPSMMVAKDGKLFFAVSADGAKIADVAGIDTAGYKSEADAWTAIMALAGA